MGCGNALTAHNTQYTHITHTHHILKPHTHSPYQWQAFSAKGGARAVRDAANTAAKAAKQKLREGNNDAVCMCVCDGVCVMMMCM